MTQTEFDDKVLGIADHEIRLGNIACDMYRQNDPDSLRRGDELIMLQNILAALKNYDITSEILTDDEIDQYFEMAVQIVQNCPQ